MFERESWKNNLNQVIVNLNQQDIEQTLILDKTRQL